MSAWPDAEWKRNCDQPGDYSLSVCLCLVCLCFSLPLSLSVCLCLCFSLSLSLSVCLCFSLSLSLSISVSLSLCPFLCLSLFLSVLFSVCLCLSVCVSLCLSVCLSLPLSLSVSVCLSLSLSLMVLRCLMSQVKFIKHRFKSSTPFGMSKLIISLLTKYYRNTSTRHTYAYPYKYIHICQGTNQNSVGFQILPVEMKIEISPGRNRIVISTDSILNHTTTDRNLGFHREKS